MNRQRRARVRTTGSPLGAGRGRGVGEDAKRTRASVEVTAKAQSLGTSHNLGGFSVALRWHPGRHCAWRRPVWLPEGS